jgi:hypothetical protein
MLASGRIVATSVPLRLRILSTDIVSSHRAARLPLSLTCVALPLDYSGYPLRDFTPLSWPKNLVIFASAGKGPQR